jgi:hypothetical protein
LTEKTLNGSMMSMLIDPQSVTRSCFNTRDMITGMEQACLPMLKKIIIGRVMKRLREKSSNNGGFDPRTSKEMESALNNMPMTIAAHYRQIALNIQSLVADADEYQWPLEKLLREVRQLFTYAQAQALTGDLLSDAVKASRLALFEQGCR